MQIGRGRQGVRIGEYVGEYGYSEDNPLPETINEKAKPDSNPILGYIEPAGANPQWILWFKANGDAILHRKRSDTGGTEDEPLMIKAQRTRPPV